MSEQLVHIDSSQQALVQGGLGLNGRMFAVRPDILELVQLTTRDKLPQEVGKFRSKTTKQLFDEIQVVFLRTPVESRVLFEGDELGSEPLCRSNDGLRPSPDAQVVQSPSCGYYDQNGRYIAICDHASWKAWGKAKTAQEKKDAIPRCKQKFQLFFVERTTKLPFYLGVGGKSIKPLVDAMQQIARLVEVLRSQKENPSIFDFSMKLRPVHVDGKKGSYYVIGFFDIAQIKAEDRTKFGELFAQYANRSSEEIAAEQEEVLKESLTEDTNLEA